MNVWNLHSVHIMLCYGGYLYRGYLYSGYLYRGYLYSGYLYRGYLYSGYLYRGYLYRGYLYRGYLYRGYLYIRFISEPAYKRVTFTQLAYNEKLGKQCSIIEAHHDNIHNLSAVLVFLSASC